MNMNQISTSTLNTSMTDQLQKMQAALVKAQTESSTGRVADVGLALGAGTEQSVSLRSATDQLQSIQDSNKIVSTRLSSTQNVVTSLLSTAQSFLQSLISDGSSGSASPLPAQALINLRQTESQLNTNVNGSYIFGGINSGVTPIADYTSTPTSSAKTALDASFTTAFGMSQTSASVSSITATQMQSYLDGAFAGLTQGSGWTNTSSASSTVQQGTIGQNETVNTSVSANDPAFQQLTSAYTMIAELNGGNFSTTTAQVITTVAIKTLTSAISGLKTISTDVGSTQSAISASNDSMTAQVNILNVQIGNLENVDPYTAATQVSALQTQIQTAYSLTARMEQLSLVKYLPV